MQEYLEYLEIAKKAARKAGLFLLDDFYSDKLIQKSSDIQFDVKLDSDEKSEKIILDILGKELSGHCFISEEIGKVGQDSEYVWYIDPLDGTNNFSIGIPYFGISMVLLHKDNPVLAVIYNPFLDEMYEAVLGRGCSMNGKRIKYRSTKKDLSDTVLAFTRGHKSFLKPELKKSGDKAEECIEGKFRRIIRMWSPVIDFTQIVKGKLDLMIAYELEEQERYVGLLLCMEAGVPVVDLNGEIGGICSTSYILGEESTSLMVAELLKERR